MQDALNRAFAFCDAGADGIMIHSRKSDPSEVFDFCHNFRQNNRKTPLIVVPTTFNSVKEEDLARNGVNIVIYANQLMRAAFPTMKYIAEQILINHRTEEIEDRLMHFKDIIRLIDEI